MQYTKYPLICAVLPSHKELADRIERKSQAVKSHATFVKNKKKRSTTLPSFILTEGNAQWNRKFRLFSNEGQVSKQTFAFDCVPRIPNILVQWIASHNKADACRLIRDFPIEILLVLTEPDLIAI